MSAHGVGLQGLRATDHTLAPFIREHSPTKGHVSSQCRARSANENARGHTWRWPTCACAGPLTPREVWSPGPLTCSLQSDALLQLPPLSSLGRGRLCTLCISSRPRPLSPSRRIWDCSWCLWPCLRSYGHALVPNLSRGRPFVPAGALQSSRGGAGSEKGREGKGECLFGVTIGTLTNKAQTAAACLGPPKNVHAVTLEPLCVTSCWPEWAVQM